MSDSNPLFLKRIVKLQNELRKPIKDEGLIRSISNILSKDIEIASKIDEFYDIPFKTLCRIIEKVDFSTVEDSINVIKTIVKKCYESYDNAIDLLTIITCKACTFNLKDMIEILNCFKNSQLLSKLCDIYNDMEQLPSIDYKWYEDKLEQKKEKIYKLQRYNRDIFKAAESGDLQSIKFMVEEQYADIDRTTNRSRNTPLHFACMNGRQGVIEYLIKKGASITCEAKYGITPIRILVSNGYSDIIKYLFDKKLIENKKVEHTFFRTNTDIPKLFLIACGYLELDIAKYLIEKQKYDINIRSSCGDSALHIVCNYKWASEFIHYLTQKNELMVNYKNNDGETPLHKACKKGSLENVKSLLEIASIDINSQNLKNQTPLDFAYELDQGEDRSNIINLLIGHGAIANIPKN